MGPLLFLVMINDLATTLDDRWKYVDDLSLIECCRKNLPSRAGSLMNLLCLVGQRCQEAKVDKMTVNFDKSVFLTFSFLKSMPVFNPPIPSASHVTEIKLLGLHITSDLKWNKHVDGMLKKANLAIRSLKLLARHGIPAPHLLRIYFSFIHSTLEYVALYGIRAD